MLNIVLLRHGKVDGAAALYGKTDIQVSSEVNSNMLALLNEYQQKSTAPFTSVISSPLQRCSFIAEKFAQQHNLPFTREKNFQEMDFGLVDGITFDDIKASEYSEQTWKQLERFWNAPNKHVLPDAEPLTDFYQRVESAWCSLIENHSNETLLLVCHGGVIRMVLSYLLQVDRNNKNLYEQLCIENASATIVKYSSTIQHSQVVSVSVPLECFATSPNAFNVSNSIHKKANN